MRKSKVVLYLASSVSLMVLSGCATNLTPADHMRAEADEIQIQVDLRNQLAKNWEKGAKMISTGEKHIKSGEKLLESAQRDQKKGQADIKLGKQEISEGQKLILESEKQFRENFPEQDIKSVQ